MKTLASLAAATCLALSAAAPAWSADFAAQKKAAQKKRKRRDTGNADRNEPGGETKPAESEPQRKTLPEGVNPFTDDYAGEPVSIQVDGVSLYEFLDFFGEQYGVNFVIDKSVSADSSVSVRAQQVPWNRVVLGVLEANGNTLEPKYGLFRVLSRAAAALELKQRIEERNNALLEAKRRTEIYRLRYRSVRTGGYLDPTAARGGVLGLSGGSNIVTRSGGTAGGQEGGEALSGGLRSILIAQLTSVGTLQEDPVSNAIIVNDTEEGHARISATLNELDKPSPQVMVEARILVARRDYIRQLGALLNLSVNGPGAGGQAGTAPNPIAGRGPGNGAGIPGEQPASVTGLGTSAAGVFGFVIQKGTYNIGLAINALEQRGISQTVLAPRLVVANNTTANIGNGVDVPYVQAAPIGGGPGGVGVGVAQITQLVNASLGFTVTPQVIGDGEEIALAIEIRNDAPSGVTPLGQPILQRQNVTTTVRCPDGGAVILSGLLTDSERNQRDGVPGLRKIPVFGRLFDKEQIDRTQFELIFFVTAKVITPVKGEQIIERPEGVALPNAPEIGSRSLPPLESKPRVKLKYRVERRTPPEVQIPNAPQTSPESKKD